MSEDEMRTRANEIAERIKALRDEVSALAEQAAQDAERRHNAKAPKDRGRHIPDYGSGCMTRAMIHLKAGAGELTEWTTHRAKYDWDLKPKFPAEK